MPRFLCRAAGLFFVAAVADGCSPPKPPDLAPPDPPTVTVAHPEERNLAPYTEFTGTLRAVEAQEVRARVSGYLTKVLFTEGGSVKKGDPLYEIDPRPYRATLDKANGEVANARAQARRADADLNRAKKLTGAGGGGISQGEYDQFVATKDTAEAMIQSATATVDAAALDLEFTTVRSEVTGKVSRTLITAGNYVQAGQTVLTRVTTEAPIYAYWDVDELTSLWYREQIGKQGSKLSDPLDATKPADQRRMKCWIRLKNEPEGVYPREGYIDFYDVSLDRGTNTRQVRGVFDNKDKFLLPNDSVRVRVEAGGARKQVTIPEVAVGSQQKQKYVFVVTPTDEIEFRPVTLGPVRDGVQVVEAGLSPADRVVVNGLLRVRAGVKVKPVPASKG